VIRSMLGLPFELFESTLRPPCVSARGVPDGTLGRGA